MRPHYIVLSIILNPKTSPSIRDKQLEFIDDTKTPPCQPQKHTFKKKCVAAESEKNFI